MADEEPSLFDSMSQLLNSDLIKTLQDNASAPKVIWPGKFTVKMSTNTVIYNTTIGMRFDSQKNRIWSQVNYTSAIFGDFEAFQIAIFPNDKNVSLKIDDECRWSYVQETSYIYLSLIFNSWSYYTKYIGKDKDGLHEFHLSDYVQSQKMGNITFLFREKEGQSHVELAKVGVQSSTLQMPIMLTVIEPVTERPDLTDKGMQLLLIKYLLFSLS
jgi:hypothetical protein